MSPRWTCQTVIISLQNNSCSKIILPPTHSAVQMSCSPKIILAHWTLICFTCNFKETDCMYYITCKAQIWTHASIQVTDVHGCVYTSMPIKWTWKPNLDRAKSDCGSHPLLLKESGCLVICRRETSCLITKICLRLFVLEYCQIMEAPEQTIVLNSLFKCHLTHSVDVCLKAFQLLPL